MVESYLEICPDCKVALPTHLGAIHPYFGASPSCWALFGEVLAREYASAQLMIDSHRLTVDAYAAQHPGTPERRAIQSVWVHLAGLYLTVECGRSHRFANRVIGALAAQSGRLEWLQPPDNLGEITIAEAARAASADDHQGAVRRWARCVWAAWHPHHEAISALADRMAARL